MVQELNITFSLSQIYFKSVIKIDYFINILLLLVSHFDDVSQIYIAMKYSIAL